MRCQRLAPDNGRAGLFLVRCTGTSEERQMTEPVTLEIFTDYV
jgi:hypothetical protein